MKKSVYITLLLLLVLPNNLLCGQSQEKLNLNQQVFYDLFPDLIDSIYHHEKGDPPLPLKVGSNGKPSPEDSLAYQKALEEWRKSQRQYWRDSTAVYYFIPDSVGAHEKEDATELLKYFGKSLKIETSKPSVKYPLQLSELKTNRQHLRFKYASDIPEQVRDLKQVIGLNIKAYLSFTSILFDRNRRYGIFNVGISKAPLNGYGLRVFIRKTENGSWVIVGTKGTWIS